MRRFFERLRWRANQVYEWTVTVIVFLVIESLALLQRAALYTWLYGLVGPIRRLRWAAWRKTLRVFSAKPPIVLDAEARSAQIEQERRGVMDAAEVTSLHMVASSLAGIEGSLRRIVEMAESDYRQHGRYFR